jgi:hypothetical protein
LLVKFFFKSMVNMGNKVTVLQSVSVPRNILDEKNFNILSKYNLYTFARHIFFQIYGEHGQQSYCSTIGFRTPEYLGCPGISWMSRPVSRTRFTGTGTCIGLSPVPVNWNRDILTFLLVLEVSLHYTVPNKFSVQCRTQ